MAMKRVNSSKAKERYYSRRIPDSLSHALNRNLEDIMITEEQDHLI